MNLKVYRNHFFKFKGLNITDRFLLGSGDDEFGAYFYFS